MGIPFSEEFIKILEQVDYFDFRSPHDWTGQEELKEWNSNNRQSPSVLAHPK